MRRLNEDVVEMHSSDADCDSGNPTDIFDNLDDAEYLHRPSKGSRRKGADFMIALDNHEEKVTHVDSSVRTMILKRDNIGIASKTLLSNLTNKIESQAKRKNPVNLGSLSRLKDATFAPRSMSQTESSKPSHHSHLIQNLPNLQVIHAAQLQHGWSKLL